MAEQVIPYWRGLVAEAQAAGVKRLCLELHGQQNVYNVGTLFRLREAVGPDRRRQFRSEPSVLDGRRSARRGARAGRRDLSRARQGYAHQSDHAAVMNSRIDTKPMDRLRERSW